MATTTSESYLSIKVLDVNQSVTTFKINNPVIDNETITRAKVEAAFQPIFSSGILYNRNNVVYASLGEIAIIEITTRKTDIT